MTASNMRMLLRRLEPSGIKCIITNGAPIQKATFYNTGDGSLMAVATHYHNISHWNRNKRNKTLPRLKKVYKRSMRDDCIHVYRMCEDAKTWKAARTIPYESADASINAISLYTDAVLRNRSLLLQIRDNHQMPGVTTNIG